MTRYSVEEAVIYPRDVDVHMRDGTMLEFKSKLVAYQGGFLILRNPQDLNCAHAIPADRISDVIEGPVP